jgi:DNA-binding response OmpR family regulator
MNPNVSASSLGTVPTALSADARLTTASLRDDEIRAIADAVYRDDNPLRFDSVRQAALMFERYGYRIVQSPEPHVSALPAQLRVGPLVVDRTSRLAAYDGRELSLQMREFDMLELFARHPGRVFTRTQLLDLAWPRDFDGDDRVVDVQVARLRRKFDALPQHPRPIATVHGVGYKLAAHEAVRSA